MADKICPKYKAAMITGTIVSRGSSEKIETFRSDEKRFNDIIECDGENCGCWVKEHYAVRKYYDNSDNKVSEDVFKIPAHCGLIGGE